MGWLPSLESPSVLVVFLAFSLFSRSVWVSLSTVCWLASRLQVAIGGSVCWLDRFSVAGSGPFSGRFVPSPFSGRLSFSRSLFSFQFVLLCCRFGPQPAQDFFLRVRWVSPPLLRLVRLLLIEPRWGLHSCQITTRQMYAICSDGECVEKLKI